MKLSQSHFLVSAKISVSVIQNQHGVVAKTHPVGFQLVKENI